MILQNNNPYTSPSFSYGNRLRRLIWSMVYATFFRTTPRAMHAWRNLLLRSFGASIGKHVHIHGSALIWAPWNLKIGDYVGIGEHVNLYNMALLSIGSYSVISQGAHLCGGSHDFNSDNFQLIASPITVGRRVWICADAFVGHGVSIADGSVIGARSVVARSIVESWTVWAGTPVKAIGKRKVHSVPL